MNILDHHINMALEIPDGIQKLRELILTLAMQGKLVDQDPTDQPAGELLKEIEAEKKRLNKAGKIKKQKPVPPIKEEEIPYDLPDGWVWTRFDDICSKITQGPNPKYDGDENPKFGVLKTKDFYDDKVLYDNISSISEIVFRNFERFKLLNHDIIFGLVGKGSTGKCNIFEEQSEAEYIFTRATGLFRLVNYEKINPKMVKQFFISGYGKKKSEEITDGTTGQLVIKTSELKKLLLPLPPIKEQKRIVKKVDQLMALCDKLEVQKTEQNQKRLKIHTGIVDKMLNASDPQTFNQSWEFITRHFDDIYSVPENVGELKKAILQLAVMGKLIPQDPADQPAKALLKEIEAEKKRLIKEGKIKKPKPLPPIKADEIPYDLPEGWVWCRIQDVGFVLGGKRLPKGESYSESPTPYRYLTVTNMKNGTIVDNTVKFIDESVRKKIEKYIINKEDIYITIAGTIGDVGSIPAKYDGMNLTENACKVVFFELDKNCLINTIRSKVVQSQFEQFTNKLAQPKLSLRSILSTIMPLHPLNEQKRIVQKVDQLMALCDGLENQLQNSTEKQTQILDAVLTTV
jgi:type I restriction enzyme S subunit